MTSTVLKVVSFGNMCTTISQSIHVSALVDAVTTASML